MARSASLKLQTSVVLSCSPDFSEVKEAHTENHILKAWWHYRMQGYAGWIESMSELSLCLSGRGNVSLSGPPFEVAASEHVITGEGIALPSTNRLKRLNGQARR